MIVPRFNYLKDNHSLVFIINNCFNAIMLICIDRQILYITIDSNLL